MNQSAVIGCKAQFTPPMPKRRDGLVRIRRRRRRRHRVASSDHRVALSWPCSTASLQRLTGTDPLLLRSWMVCLTIMRTYKSTSSVLTKWMTPCQADLTVKVVACWSPLHGWAWAELGLQCMWPNADRRRRLVNLIRWQANASGYFCTSDVLKPVKVENLALPFHEFFRHESRQ